MKTIRLEKIHLFMIGFILFGLVVISDRLFHSELITWLVVLLEISLLIGMLYFQKGSYELSEVETIERLNHQTEDSLKNLLDKMPVGVVRFDPETDAILWFNPYAQLVFTSEDGEMDLKAMRQVIDQKRQEEAHTSLPIFDSQYMVYLDSESDILYFFDAAVAQVTSQSLEAQPVIGLISVDNYDEITDNLSDAQVSKINSFIADFIAAFAKTHAMFYRRVSRDRFFFFTDYKVLKDLMANKFSILDNFREKAQENQLSLTLSMGIAYGSGEQDKIGNLANQNLNMALMRGGDQVVVKENDNQKKILYFGGGTVSTVKRSRTRTRAMMTAISDKIKQADQVFVVGHRNLDMDALGASVGMQFFSSNVIDQAYVVYDPQQMNRGGR